MLIPLALLAAGLTAPLTPRPADLVPPGQAAAYAAWFEGRTTQLSRLHAAGCVAPAIHSLRFRFATPASILRSPTQEAALDGPFYREAYEVTGCGPLAVQNVMVAHQRGGGWRGVGTLPGATLADMRLQNDAGMMAASAALTRPAPGCATEQARTSLKIVDTELITTPRNAQAPWTERWMITTCGLPAPVTMTFTPTPGPGGTAFSARRD